MVLRFFLLAVIFLFTSCTEVGKRDNPDDPDGINYGGDRSSSSDIAYKTTKIGSQMWMAENLDSNVSGSVCYKDNEDNCVTHGRLYDWATAMDLHSDCNRSSCASQISPKHRGICPDGWHIPSNAEWNALITAVGGGSTAGRYLKATYGWNSVGNGEDKYGFSALAGGYGSGSSFNSFGTFGFWWSSTEFSSIDAYYRAMSYGSEEVDYSYGTKNRLYSVRCVQD